MATIHTPHPELLSRKDVAVGNWQVDSCEPKRGIPATNVVTKQMLAPSHDTDVARAIRAHEMMHAKVSPAHDFAQWISRGLASQQALIVAEELRVNYLCGKAGFNMKSHLTDGSETADGERVSATDDWVAAVHMCIATAGTASHKAFLTGIRRGNRKWGKMLLTIGKQAMKEMDKSFKTGTLASTDVEKASGLYPLGFIHTERIAEWIDRLAQFNPDDEPEEEKESGESDKGDSEEEAVGGAGAKKDAEVKPKHTGTEKAKEGTGVKRKIADVSATTASSRIPTWVELKIERLPMPKLTRGNLGKRKVASDTGRNPRRMHRLLTDPQKRVFDKTIRGMGGVVLIDASGSMSFTHDQIRRIVEASPGCTVAMYSTIGNNNTNLWILAEKGKMCDALPRAGGGNGVDHPALEWAIKQKQRSSTPVIWVTDGGVTGQHDNMNDTLTMQCIKTSLKHNVIILPYVEEAVETLGKMKNGHKPKRSWPSVFQRTYHNLEGRSLPN
jgi:hypothetical protein